MNRREAMAAMAAVAIAPNLEAAPLPVPPRVFRLDWLRYFIIDGKTTTEARIRNETGWYETRVEGDTIQLASDVRLVVGPGKSTLVNDGAEEADLILGNMGSMSYWLGPKYWEYADGPLSK